MIAALILAAGRSTRMGTPKMLIPLAGRTVLRHVLDHARASRCDAVVVVAGEKASEVAAEAGPTARVVINPRYADGMATSVAAGIAALAPDCAAAVVLLGDQPCVTASMIDALIDAFLTTGKPIIASRYDGVTGAPTLIGAALFSEARSLCGDTGGRFLIARYPDLVETVSLPPSASADLDTPEDLARLRAALGDRTPPAR